MIYVYDCMFSVLISVLWSKITPECNTHFSALIFSFLVFSVFLVFVCVCVCVSDEMGSNDSETLECWDDSLIVLCHDTRIFTNESRREQENLMMPFFKC